MAYYVTGLLLIIFVKKIRSLGALFKGLLSKRLKMKKLIIACVTVGVAVGAGVWLYKRWKENKKKSSEDEVSAKRNGQNLAKKQIKTKNNLSKHIMASLWRSAR